LTRWKRAEANGRCSRLLHAFASSSRPAFSSTWSSWRGELGANSALRISHTGDGQPTELTSQSTESIIPVSTSRDPQRQRAGPNDNSLTGWSKVCVCACVCACSGKQAKSTPSSCAPRASKRQPPSFSHTHDESTLAACYRGLEWCGLDSSTCPPSPHISYTPPHPHAHVHILTINPSSISVAHPPHKVTLYHPSSILPQGFCSPLSMVSSTRARRNRAVN
jgi:hypothetical protein